VEEQTVVSCMYGHGIVQQHHRQVITLKTNRPCLNETWCLMSLLLREAMVAK